MTKKQRDLKKLKLYTKALGFKVYFKKAKRDSPSAEWTHDKTITFYISSRVTKKHLILVWLHEICHEFDFRERHKQDSEILYDALAAEDARRNKSDLKVDKSMRKLIYEDEKRAASYRQQLRKQLDLESVTEQEVQEDIELDLWAYKWYYEKGNFPTLRQVHERKQQQKARTKKGINKRR